MIDTRTDPDSYRHWRLRFEPPIAYLILDVQEEGGLFPGYKLKQNSYDLGVDIELYDAVQRLRFEHPEIRSVVIESGRDRVFCAGANIGMLGTATHQHKVNFCKFTNETRLGIEDASEGSGQRYLTAISGTAAGGGYEVALASDLILLADDGSSAVSLPEVPLLGVLPGTGGLTRLVDKRKVRRDRADIFCTLEEGMKGRRALEWGLVDELIPKSRFAEVVKERALALAETSDRPEGAKGVELVNVDRQVGADQITYSRLRVELDRELGVARFVLLGPDVGAPESLEEVENLGVSFWPLELVRQLDDAILHLRLNESRLGLWLFASEGDAERVMEHDRFLERFRDHWLVREILLFWKRTFKRVDVSARTLFTLLEPGSCFAGFLAELVFAADRSYMFEGDREGLEAEPAALRLSELNFGPFPTPNGLTRLETRFLGDPERLKESLGLIGEPLEAGRAEEVGLVTMAFDDIDWDDELRIAIEERVSFSSDSLTGLEANLRFPGPETFESKIFGRLSAWQNWIFQRPNAVGEEGALRRYGSGLRPNFDSERT